MNCPDQNSLKPSLGSAIRAFLRSEWRGIVSHSLLLQLNLLSPSCFNVLIKWQMRGTDPCKGQKVPRDVWNPPLLSSPAPESPPHQRERQGRQKKKEKKARRFCTLKPPLPQFKRPIFTENKFKGEFLMYIMVSGGRQERCRQYMELCKAKVGLLKSVCSALINWCVFYFLYDTITGLH